MDRDLFLSILAMDTYNRGYGAGIKDLGGFGTQIGSATILNFDLPSGSETTGFYALAYSYNGETIISYRGTDTNFLDPAYSYSLAIGDNQATQARLAIEFYQNVIHMRDTPGNPGNSPYANNATLTGHSLGGGLAGFVGAIYGQNGVLFDNMPFELVANDNDISQEKAA